MALKDDFTIYIHENDFTIYTVDIRFNEAAFNEISNLTNELESPVSQALKYLLRNYGFNKTRFNEKFDLAK